MPISSLLVVGDALVDWPVVMATTLLAMLPPVIVVVPAGRGGACPGRGLDAGDPPRGGYRDSGSPPASMRKAFSWSGLTLTAIWPLAMSMLEIWPTGMA